MARGKWLRRGEQPEQVSGSFGSDQDACCVQAFTKGARFSEAASFHLFTSPFNTGNAMKPPQSFLTVPRKSEGATFGAEGAGVGGDGFVDGKSKRITSDGGDIDPRVVGGVNQGRHERGAAAPTKDNSLSAPVFYRTAWRRTGEKLFVWKITSRWVQKGSTCCLFAHISTTKVSRNLHNLSSYAPLSLGTDLKSYPRPLLPLRGRFFTLPFYFVFVV